jgi:hypothetical protein
VIQERACRPVHQGSLRSRRQSFRKNKFSVAAYTKEVSQNFFADRKNKSNLVFTDVLSNKRKS